MNSDFTTSIAAAVAENIGVGLLKLGKCPHLHGQVCFHLMMGGRWTYLSQPERNNADFYLDFSRFIVVVCRIVCDEMWRLDNAGVA